MALWPLSVIQGMRSIHMVFLWKLVPVRGIHLESSNAELPVDMFTVPKVQEIGIIKRNIHVDKKSYIQ